MDNTGYYIGDTIYFKAYMRLSTGQPSDLSGLLYVELLDNDGYLVERQNIRMTYGQGNGCFVLTDSLYGGYYEIRAYTRWQLNWGRYEHEHSYKVHKWFYSKRMMDEYYRDYEKLYSRVFPVYDKPKKAGEYDQQMTVRPLQRYFKQKIEEKKAEVVCYPEGGNLVMGVKNRIAFEANDNDGRHLKGELEIRDRDGNVVACSKTLDRGRGMFEFAPSDSTSRYRAVFKFDGDKEENVILPKAETDGCSMRADVKGDSIMVYLSCVGEVKEHSLAMTVMCHGVMRIYRPMGKGSDLNTIIDTRALPNGVTQLTVFSPDGHVWADRLVFVRHRSFKAHNISVSGLANEVLPYQKVNLNIQGEDNATVSIAVRDRATSPQTFDGANIMTELLLSSQIRGYIEQPDWYFESDDEEHHKALDLLLMIQGWRRYDWKTMTTPGAFTADEPYEKTPWIYGEVNKFDVTVEGGDFRLFQDPKVLMEESSADNIEYQNYCSSENPGPEYDKACEEYFTPDFVRRWHGLVGAKAAAMILFYKLGRPDTAQARDGMFDTQIRDLLTNEILNRIERQHKPVGNLDHEVTVHAEFALDHKVKDGRARAADGDMLTYDKGQFRIKVPDFDGYCRFFCSASDQTKWKNGKAPKWLDDAEYGADNDGDFGQPNFPAFYVRLKDPYPRFVKPYNFYHTAEPTVSTTTGSGKIKRVDDVRVMDEVVIGAKRNGSRKFDKRYPAFVLDAYDAFNAAVDAGFNPGYYGNSARYIGNVAHTYIGDMNEDRNYNIIPRFNSLDMSVYMSDYMRTKYDHLHFIDKVYIYTDYSPRREGDKHFEMQNQPPVTVDLRRPIDNSQYKTYRDRYKVVWGFSAPVEFYSPDYGKMKAPEAGDYRRTIYWNPDVKLDSNGKASVQFFNNGQITELKVSANGMTANGELLCN